MSRTALFALLVSGLIAIAVQPMSAATPSLAGSWQFTLTPATITGTPAVEIPGLATFTTDGSVIETDGSEFAVTSSATAVAAKAGTPGHGIWQLANTPETLFVQYISLVLDADGALYAQNVTTMFVVMDTTTARTFKGTYSTVQTIGTLTRVLSSGTVTGQLIPHLPLP
jgi:hypothetical protein